MFSSIEIFPHRTKLADAESGGEACANYLLRILPLNDVEECFQWQSSCPSSKLPLLAVVLVNLLIFVSSTILQMLLRWCCNVKAERGWKSAKLSRKLNICGQGYALLERP